MKLFAALGGVLLGFVLLFSGYSIAFPGAIPGYHPPLWLGAIAAIALPVLYWSKASRILGKIPSRLIFAAMIGALLASWGPLVIEPERWHLFMPALAVFSAVWLVAALPFLRAGIRHRPR
ncbi:hypothetical protein [Qipengyuania sphaerica]|uniref:hypothetical protein n=1 Tax=Qipengyuania sphaerica TaxID=2867243 RepID=UPI001C87208E|nr:hypothetical protein [Qipengyuania sphaerica]MBX7539737.1 hypothetical protein [Qipengyuania sphaerica]